jgi:hypothetical protein
MRLKTYLTSALLGITVTAFCQVDPPVLKPRIGLLNNFKLFVGIEHANLTNWLQVNIYTNLATPVGGITSPFQVRTTNNTDFMFFIDSGLGHYNQLYVRLLDLTQSGLPATPVTPSAPQTTFINQVDGAWPFTWKDMYADSYELVMGIDVPGSILTNVIGTNAVVPYGWPTQDGTHSAVDGFYVSVIAVKNGQRSGASAPFRLGTGP